MVWIIQCNQLVESQQLSSKLHFMQTLLRPIICLWQLWETSRLFYLSVLAIGPQAALRTSQWQISGIRYNPFSLIYVHCAQQGLSSLSLNSSWTGECHTMVQVTYAEKSITSLHWDHRVNSWGILVNIISSLSNIHMVWYLQRTSTPLCIQSSQCLWVRAWTRPAGAGC